ncbi:DNA-binding LacI/PurR family transcriptional regulator [Arthrobacter ginsengisoli]|uniref:DNA-binding LacI/PurR family transcriptional regulator n=1 Tax=Arthrobacter ginsengisoli TaxID=1356565 RepID=A0ABU1UC14_9MICC|nr:LacI family DNA-binding transcriptional regulator [Arthrobacter ginsengisoli]MDR7082716.1 DNA-binding LacI/PurR family transcriptional regulator [Arthrobacter ginsengisoli]
MKHQEAAKRPTINDVAREAGVSRALVSLVLRGSPKVSEERRQAVAEAIAALDYRPSNAARWLASGRTRTVGVLLDDLANPWFVELLDGLQSVLGGQNLRMVLSDPTYLARPGESPVSAFMDLRVDGLIIAGDVLPDDSLVRATMHTPTVIAGARALRLPSADIVTNDDVAGAHLAVEHLIGLGHHNIAYLSAPTESAGLRASSYQDAMALHGLGEHIRVVQTDLSEHSGYEAMNSLLQTGRPPTAVLAANDILAVGALSAADEHGMSVPSRLSLVGYDNTYLAGIRHISLTSVDPVSRDVGIRCAQLLLERMADPSLPQRTEVLAPHLVVRHSTGTARRD